MIHHLLVNQTAAATFVTFLLMKHPSGEINQPSHLISYTQYCSQHAGYIKRIQSLSIVISESGNGGWHNGRAGRGKPLYLFVNEFGEITEAEN